jgi:hypothetical protein
MLPALQVENMHRCKTEAASFRNSFPKCQPLPVLALACLFFVGCGSEFVPVSGRVTQNGKPVSGAVVTFQPGGKRGAPPPKATGSTGRTDAEGHFSLRVISPDKPGAIAGEHTVTISVPKSEGESASAKTASSKAKPLPKEWQDGSKRFTVPKDGTDAANFDIQQR